MSGPERLVYWYLRLNGFLTTENFIIHPDKGAVSQTDADILGVRFGFRAENLVRPMADDHRIVNCPTFANIIIGEVKRGLCKVNGPWSNPEHRNMLRVLRAIGCVPRSLEAVAAEGLYTSGYWCDRDVMIRVMLFGEQADQKSVIPLEQQITWDHLVPWVIERFRKYRAQKSDVGQWTEEGKALKQIAISFNRDDKERELRARELFGLRQEVGA